MQSPNRIQSGKSNSKKGILKIRAISTAQVRDINSFTDTSPTQQVVMPFDLGDVARAFNGSFASRFAHLEDQSDD